MNTDSEKKRVTDEERTERCSQLQQQAMAEADREKRDWVGLVDQSPAQSS
jgi:hypothetical protein